MRWLELAVGAPAEEEDVAAAVLAACGTAGAWVEPSRIRGYFPAPADGSGAERLPLDFAAAWRRIAGAPCPYAIEAREVPTEDWLAGWRRSARPLRVGARLWIAPPGAPPAPAERNGAAVVWIEPGQGFGTGSHPTTRSLLGWIDHETERRTGGEVLDVGTGSGVLALAAIARGARHAVGLDVDRAAIEDAAGNRGRNGVRDRFALVHGTLDALRSGARFDLVLANLDGEALPRLLPRLARHCRPGGRLGIAGALVGDREGLLERAAGAGLEVVAERSTRDPAGDAWWSAWLHPSDRSNAA